MTKENENNKEQEDLKETWVNEELQVEESMPEEKPSWFSQNKTILGIVAVVLLGIAIVWMFKGTGQPPKKEEKTLSAQFSETWEKSSTTEKSAYVTAVAAIVGGTTYVIYKGPKTVGSSIKNWFKNKLPKNNQQQPVAGNNTTSGGGVDASAQAGS